MDDAERCHRLGWSAAEWEGRALADDGVRAAYDDSAQLERELDAFARVVWSLRTY